MYVLTLFSILSGVFLIAESYSWGDPCNVLPRGPWNQTDTVDETVPQNCHNGTFRWDYPQGTINLKFPMANGLSMSVCLRDFLGGDIFIIHDITDGQFIPIEITDRWNHMDIDTPDESDGLQTLLGSFVKGLDTIPSLWFDQSQKLKFHHPNSVDEYDGYAKNIN